MPLKVLWLLVVLVPAVSSYGLDWMSSALAGRPERFLPGSHALLLRAVLVSLPFVVLVMVATYARKAATPAWDAAVRRAARLGVGLNLLLWTVYHGIVAVGAMGADGAGGRPGGLTLAVGVVALLSPAWIGYAMRRSFARMRGSTAAGN